LNTGSGNDPGGKNSPRSEICIQNHISESLVIVYSNSDLH
jgi:hypothetical protein